MTINPIQWKDATSYSRGDRGKVPPRSWETTVCDLHILVISGHLYSPSNWVLTCYAMGIEAKSIGPVSAISAEEAQTGAIAIISKLIFARIKADTKSLVELGGYHD